GERDLVGVVGADQNHVHIGVALGVLDVAGAAPLGAVVEPTPEGEVVVAAVVDHAPHPPLPDAAIAVEDAAGDGLRGAGGVLPGADRHVLTVVLVIRRGGIARVAAVEGLGRASRGGAAPEGHQQAERGREAGAATALSATTGGG
ncbi:MAG: hypothetical protein ACK559_32770, partial [bacterium]